jgi:hypothetical protein
MALISAGSSDASWRLSRSAERLHSEGTSSSAATAGWSAAPTTPAVIDTARSARVWHALSGSRRVRPSCCRCPTTMSSSPCRRRRRRSRSRTSARSTLSCSELRPMQCATSPLTPSISAQRSAQSPCCTPGDRHCSTIRICIASCQAAACRPTARGGWRADRASFCRCVFSPGGSVSCSSHGYGRHSPLVN